VALQFFKLVKAKPSALVSEKKHELICLLGASRKAPKIPSTDKNRPTDKKISEKTGFRKPKKLASWALRAECCTSS
jgi:hypothetical protein